MAFEQQGYDFRGLVEQLFGENAGSPRLTLRSSVRNGYYVDYDRRFERYFEDDGGYGRMEMFRPTAAGWMEVSLPAYDSATGYVLVYEGRVFGPLCGFGGIQAYKYEGGRLVEVAFVGLWKS